MRVNVGPIKGRKGAVLDLEFDEPAPSPWEGQVEFSRPVRVVAKVTNTGDAYYVVGAAEVNAQAVCDRCLEPFPIALSARFEDIFRPERPVESRLAEAPFDVPVRDGGDELEGRSFHGDGFELDEAVYEALLLSAPSKFVCREDCNGICPRCGTDLNRGQCECEIDSIDPRLSALARLLRPED